MGPDDGREPDVFDKVRAIDLWPRFPSEVRQGEPNSGKRVATAIYAGDETAAATNPPQSQPSADGQSYDLNFENTPVASVAKVVLGDILGTGYTIDPRVQGTVSMASGRPIAKSDIAFVLENALRLSGVALVRDPAGYRLMPQAEAVGTGSIDAAGRAEPGYGISVVPLQHVSAPTLLKLVDSFATKPGMVRAEPGRNLIIIQGTGSERRNAIDLALSFDADWMRGQSVGIFPVQNSNPEPIISELEKILDSGEGGLSQNVVKFQSITRMNAVLAVTRKPEALRTVETWIRRLDEADTARAGVRVYTLKYGEARHIARILNEMFVGGGGSSASSSLDSASNQLAPGAGASASSSLGSGSGSGSGSNSSLTRLSGSNSQSSSSAFGQRSQSGSDSASASLSGGGGQGGLGLTSAVSSGAVSSGGGGTPIMQNVRITANPVNNALLIYANQENFTIIERTLRQIDRPQLQVGIDATIAEVTLNDNLTYGVQFFLTSKNLGLPADRGSVLNTAAATVTKTFINRALPGFNFLIGPEAQPNMILDALHSVTDVKVLSNPSVVVIDNEVATLQVGDEVPVSTGSATVLTTSNTVVNTIDYRNTGVILRVVPRINANGTVRLDIEQEISNVANTSTGSSSSSSSSSSSNLTPTVSQRKVRSSISVASGQTVLLAGLISERQSGVRDGVPILDQIPLIGEAFSQTGRTINRTELIIFIRPQIIRDSVDAHYVAEELRTKLRGTIGAVGAGGPLLPNYR
ncbi:type II secretion system protein GspD [Blastochloris tepida]|uniref:Type II secretion system protein GspD n=2 Tax=Blastochloris tepida TaxID=2233851 RepID=A0A348G0T2_9HYPH|nr:type II secretion system protein GspD [Blastochloris tepida]